MISSVGLFLNKTSEDQFWFLQTNGPKPQNIQLTLIYTKEAILSLTSECKWEKPNLT